MKILHLISDLSLGGAEMILYKLLSLIDKDRFQCSVFSLTDIGPMGEKIAALGFPVQDMGLRRGVVPNPFRLLRLASSIRNLRPDIIQTWLYHADLVGGLAGKLAGGIPVIWGIHHTNFDPSVNKAMTLRVVKMNSWLSGWLSTKIVCCSDAAYTVHTEKGYQKNKMKVIQNGIDLAEFVPDMQARLSVRNELCLPNDAVLIGLLARFDPLKDHQNFFKAACILHQERPDVFFILCGSDITYGNSDLRRWIEQAGIKPVTHLLGHRSDVARITAALDIATSSSCDESNIKLSCTHKHTQYVWLMHTDSSLLRARM